MSIPTPPLTKRLLSTSNDKKELAAILSKSEQSTQELIELINSNKQDEKSLKKASDLIENGFADVNHISDKEVGDTLAHTATRNGNDKMLGLLIKHGCDVNAKNNIHGLTPLHLAVERGTHDKENKVLHELIKAEDIELDAKDNDGLTPDKRALALGAVSTFQTLTTAISHKKIKDKTKWEKDFDKLPENSQPLNSNNPFDEDAIDKAFDPKIARKAFDSQVANNTKPAQKQTPTGTSITAEKREVVEATRETENAVPNEVSQTEETVNAPSGKEEKQQESKVLMFLRKIGEFVGLVKKEEETSLLNNTPRSYSSSTKTQVTAKPTKKEELTISDPAASPLHPVSSGDTMSGMNEEDRDEIERITQTLKKGNPQNVGDEVASPLHSHATSQTQRDTSKGDSSRQ